MTTSADIHNIETPSPLPTPGYLPLLSEASTPLTPPTLQGTSHSASPLPANSPRISFRSFTLPLEIGDENSKLKETSGLSSEKLSDRSSHRLSINLEDRSRGLESCERTYDGGRAQLRDRSATTSLSDAENQVTTQSSAVASIFNDTEMTSSNRTLSSLCAETESGGINVSRKDATDESTSHSIEISSKSYDEKEVADDMTKGCDDEPADPPSKLTAAADLLRLPSSTTTDFDSPMSCEQTLQELQESGFVICDSSDKVFVNTENPRATNSTNDSGDWVIIGGTTTGSLATPGSDVASPNNSFLEGGANPTTSGNVSGKSLELTLAPNNTNTFCIGVCDVKPLTGNRTSTQESEEMILDITDAKKYANREDEREVADSQVSFDLMNKDNLADDVHSQLRDQENGNRYSCTTTNVNSGQKSDNAREQQQVHACYIEADNANIFGTNRNDVREEKEVFRKTEIFENYHRLSTGTSPRFSDRSEENRETNVSVTQLDDHDNDHCSNGLTKKCQSFGYNNSPRQQTNTQQIRKCASKRNEESPKYTNLQASQIRGNIEVRIPSENAAEPCEVAHDPEGTSELMERTLDATSGTFSNVSSPTVDDAVVLRDTAAILQELALQRLSGGAVGSDVTVPARRKFDSESARKSFDSEIGREIVRERKMRQELDYARGKSEESQHLPPCLRARHARATRATLSRSLDEAKFNRMTGEATLSVKQASDDAQHCSTPNVGSGSSTCSSASEKMQLKNLGGLDLGDPLCRERIEKYKEERRTFLRDKYRSESFRGVSPKAEDDGEQALLTRLKARASRPSLH